MSVRAGLLALLNRRPMHGYQLRQEFEAATGSTWPLNIGQVYTTLARLERDELVAGDAADEAQHVFRITEQGRAEVRRWFDTPISADATPRSELAIKLALAASTPGVDVAAVIQIQRTATMLALQAYTRARESAGTDLPWLLVADSMIFAAEAQIRWLDHCEVRVNRAGGAAASPAEASAPRTEPERVRR